MMLTSCLACSPAAIRCLRFSVALLTGRLPSGDSALLALGSGWVLLASQSTLKPMDWAWSVGDSNAVICDRLCFTSAAKRLRWSGGRVSLKVGVHCSKCQFRRM